MHILFGKRKLGTIGEFVPEPVPIVLTNKQKQEAYLEIIKSTQGSWTPEEIKAAINYMVLKTGYDPLEEFTYTIAAHDYDFDMPGLLDFKQTFGSWQAAFGAASKDRL